MKDPRALFDLTGRLALVTGSSQGIGLTFEKVLRSAVANAEANHGLLGDDLFVQTIMIDEGPTLKRWRARARGRVARIRKRTCHITIKVAQAPQAVVAAPAVTEKKRTPRKKTQKKEN